MIPMSCPSCGRRGNVPLDRLNTRMHCKKCDAVFYLDGTGKPVIGEPPSAKGKGGKSSRDRDNHEPTDYIGMLINLLAKLGKKFWLTVAGGLALYGLYTAYGLFFAPPPLTASEVYGKAAHQVGEAFLNKDASTLSYMASPGTEKEVAEWVNNHRADVGDGKTTSQGVDIIPGMAPLVVNDTEPAGTDIIFMAPDATAKPGASAAMKVYNLRVYWLYIKGKLLIEGKKTLEFAKEEAEKLKKKK